VTYDAFDPCRYFGRLADLAGLWRAILTNAGILIVGPNPEIVSNAVYSVISLVAPLQYRDPVLAFTRLGDPRFADVINGSRFWKIVGTTNILAVERCEQFKMVMKVGVPMKDAESDIRKVLCQKTKRLLRKFEGELDDLLETDPYSDFIGAEFTLEDCRVIGSTDPKSSQLSPADVFEFQRTLTFAFWRESIALRENLRDSFLSMAPEEAVAGRQPYELDKMEVALQKIQEKFPGDVHWMAVIARHQHFIRRERRRLRAAPERITPPMLTN
jgi:hypothetical protein